MLKEFHELTERLQQAVWVFGLEDAARLKQFHKRTNEQTDSQDGARSSVARHGKDAHLSPSRPAV